MKLTGGNYGGYEIINNQIVLEDNTLEINQTNLENEFYILDDNQDKWFYLIGADIAIFSGINKY